jgi:hypothetical protein
MTRYVSRQGAERQKSALPGGAWVGRCTGLDQSLVKVSANRAPTILYGIIAETIRTDS